MKARFSYPWPGRLLIAALAVLVSLALGTAAPGSAIIDEMLRDPLVRLASIPAAESRITVVDIDEASLADLGAWPWPRARLADLVEIILGPLGARAVALDMVLPEAGDGPGDARLAALAAHAPLTLSVAMDYLPRHPPLAQGSPGKSRRWQDGTVTVPATGYIGNHAVFEGARCVGNIGFVPDADGAIRRLPAFSRLGDQVFPLLSVALLECAGEPIPVFSRSVTVDGFWRIPYHRDWSAYTVVPASRVLAENAPSELFAGRFVLIGSSALGLSDRVATPLSPSTSGVLVHAASLSALLDANQFRPAVGGLPIAAAWLAASLALWLTLLPRMTPLGGVSLLAVLGIGWIGLVWLIDMSLPLLPVLAAYASLLLAGIPFEWWVSRRESARVLRIFSHYVAPSVLAELLRQQGERPLEPRFREVTVLNADMEGYTRATASLELDEVASLTRDFLDCLTRPILAEEGTLDKYTGDGLVAFWNAPLPCNNQGDRAVRAAREILIAVKALNQRRVDRGLGAVRVRIGIESGLALVGDLGTSFRSTYTAVGNCINFAAKLQEAARDLPADIVIGPGARQHVHEAQLHSLGFHQPRGLDQAVELFTPATHSLR